MNDSTSTQAVQIIDHLADKLQVPADKIWGVLEQQARLELFLNIPWLVLAAIGISAAVWMLKLGRYELRNIQEKREQEESRKREQYGSSYHSDYIRQADWDETAWLIPGMFVGVVSVVLTIGTFFSTVRDIGYYLNPGYFAFQKVMEIFGK